jgi:hypothetical protein
MRGQPLHAVRKLLEDLWKTFGKENGHKLL